MKIKSYIFYPIVEKMPAATYLTSLNDVLETPLDFLFLHESVFTEGEIVENVDPDQARNWWDDIYLNELNQLNQSPHNVLQRVERQLKQMKENK